MSGGKLNIIIMGRFQAIGILRTVALPTDRITAVHRKMLNPDIWECSKEERYSIYCWNKSVKPEDILSLRELMYHYCGLSPHKEQEPLFKETTAGMTVPELVDLSKKGKFYDFQETEFSFKSEGYFPDGKIIMTKMSMGKFLPDWDCPLAEMNTMMLQHLLRHHHLHDLAFFFITM